MTMRNSLSTLSMLFWVAAPALRPNWLPQSVPNWLRLNAATHVLKCGRRNLTKGRIAYRVVIDGRMNPAAYTAAETLNDFQLVKQLPKIAFPLGSRPHLTHGSVSGQIGGYLSCLGWDGSVGKEGGVVASSSVRPMKIYTHRHTRLDYL